MKGSKIVLQGKQETMVRDGTDVAKGRPFADKRWRWTCKGPILAVVIPQLQNLLFYLDLDTGITSLPKLVANICLPNQGFC